MLLLITYDVSTESKEGRKRLRRVAKTCQGYGVRVQNSVFECVIDAAELRLLQAAIKEIINVEEDSIRYYYLGSNWKGKVEHLGAKPSVDVVGTLIE